MKTVIDASEWVQYNANTQGKYTGDCVARGLSMAFGVDYNEVRKQLNQVSRDRHGESYKTRGSILDWMQRHGGAARVYSRSRRLPKGEQDTGDVFTVSQFADENPIGVYVCLVIGNKHEAEKGESNHLVTIINGKVYDSWNSLNNYVVEAYRPVHVTSEMHEMSIDDIVYELDTFIAEYTRKLSNKYDAVTQVKVTEIQAIERLSVDTSGRRIRSTDRLTGRAKGYLHVSPEYTPCNHEQIHVKELIFKLNPRLDLDTNLDTLKKRVKQTLYDWVYNVNHDCVVWKKSQEAEFTHNMFKYERQRAVQLPEWTWPLLQEVSFNEGPWHDGYQVYMDPLPDDPDQDTVHLVEDTLTNLKRSLEDYRTSYLRDTYKY